MALTKITGEGIGTVDSAVVDNITIDGTEIDLSSGDLTLDVAGDIILDADGGDFIFKDGGSGDEANKVIRFSTPSHDTDEENVQILQVESESSSNQISFGGGTSALNSATTMRFLTSSVDTTTGSERMRIDSNGRMQITSDGQASFTSDASLEVRGQNAPLVKFNHTQNADEVNLQLRHDRARSGSTATMVQILNNSNSEVGTIKANVSATAFNTSSDYRLKENVSYNFDATSRLKQLKPARFNFIADETNTLVDGFLAHEVSHDADGNPLVPEAISGEKDAVDNEGNIKPQGIDQSKLVPLLTKTLQEQQATIEALTARITALQNA